MVLEVDKNKLLLDINYKIFLRFLIDLQESKKKKLRKKKLKSIRLNVLINVIIVIEEIIIKKEFVLYNVRMTHNFKINKDLSFQLFGLYRGANENLQPWRKNQATSRRGS